MNRMDVREYSRNDSQFGFELELKDQRSSVVRTQTMASSTASSSSSGGKEDCVIVILLETEPKRDEVLKVINDQIRGLKNIALTLVNPVANF